MPPIILFFKNIPLWEGFWWLLLENFLIWIISIALGMVIVLGFKSKKITENTPGLISTNLRLELVLSFFTIIINTFITLLGLFLWQNGIIVILPFEGGLLDCVDVLVLITLMDISMYFLHRLAHNTLFYSWLHHLHHKFDNPTPITLYSLNPLETISFGILWLSILSVYHASIVGIFIYLTFNVLFGIIGHLGVEPFPESWKSIPIVNWISSSSFHAAHHKKENVNYGFYTVLWDKLFKTFSS